MVPRRRRARNNRGRNPSGKNMTFAVIRTGGKQYKVAANDLVAVEKLAGAPGETVTFGEVLMVADDSGVTLGNPLVDGASVAAELVDTKKQKTVIVFKKNRRHNYRRRNGHRQLFTQVRITEILTGGAKPSAKAASARRAAAASEASAKPEAAAESAAPAQASEAKAPARRSTAKKSAPEAGETGETGGKE